MNGGNDKVLVIQDRQRNVRQLWLNGVLQEVHAWTSELAEDAYARTSAFNLTPRGDLLIVDAYDDGSRSPIPGGEGWQMRVFERLMDDKGEEQVAVLRLDSAEAEAAYLEPAPVADPPAPDTQ